MSLSTDSSIGSSMVWFHWGVIVSTALFGINVMQGWIYFNNNNDKWWLRLFITVLILLDLATTCLDSEILRYYSETTFGLPLGDIPTIITMDIKEILTIVVIFLVQLFMASRTYLLGCRWSAPVIIVGCTTGALISHILFVASNIMDNPVMHLSSKELKIEMAISLCLTTAADLVATAFLCQKLSSSSAHVQSRTQSVVYRLIVYFITRGFLVTITQFLNVIIYEVKPVSLYWMPFGLISSRLYVNTTLAILNTRSSLRTHLDPDMTTNVSKFGPPIFFENQSTSRPSLDVEAQITTTTTTTTETVHD